MATEPWQVGLNINIHSKTEDEEEGSIRDVHLGDRSRSQGAQTQLTEKSFVLFSKEQLITAYELENRIDID